MPYANPENALARARWRYHNQPGNREAKRQQAAAWSLKNRKRKCWLDQRATSKARGVDFKLTFEQYCEFWGEDFDRKGRNPNDLCMGRYGDEGAYEVGNIYKCTNAENKLGPEPKPVHPDIPF